MGSGAPYAGDMTAGTISVTETAAVISTSVPCVGVILQADPDNGADIMIGDASSQPVQLQPGASISLPIRNLALIWADSASGTLALNYIAIH